MISVLGRQRQAELHEFKASLVHIEISRTRNKNKNKQTKKKEKTPKLLFYLIINLDIM